MNLFERYKWLSWVVLLLLIINIAALCTILYYTHFHRHPHKMGNERGEPGMQIVRDLRFDTVQAKTFMALRDIFFRRSTVIFDSLKSKRAEIYSILSGPVPDTARLNILAEEIGDYHTMLKKNAVQHFFEVKAICTPEQVGKLGGYYRHLFMGREGKGERAGPLPHRGGGR